MPTTIAITGAEGELGSILRQQLWERGYTIRAFSRTPKVAVAGSVATEADGRIGWCHECRVADLSVADGSFSGQLAGCDAVIHLAALAKPWEPYERIHANNMLVDQAVFEEAARSCCKRVVFASTNHVQHGKSMRSTPETLDSTRFGAHLGGAGQPLMKASDEPDPDSFYAVSKLLGESLGRLYAREHGLEFVALRIGWIVKEANPLDSSWVGTDDNREYMRAMNLGHHDCQEIFGRALDVEIPGGFRLGKGSFGIAYAVSNNSRRVFDLSSTEALLGYAPVEDVECFFQ